MSVYMIRAGACGPVKIGLTTTLESRLCKMQVDNPEILTVIRFLVGGQREEKTLHILFEKNKVRGEWFSFSERMLGDLPMIDLPVPNFGAAGRIYFADEEVMHRVLRMRGANKSIAAACGISSAAVSQWRRVPLNYVERVSGITHMPRHVLRPDIFRNPFDTASTSGLRTDLAQQAAE